MTFVSSQTSALRAATAAPNARHPHSRVRPTRATACGSRVAQMWNLCGFPNLERENRSLCDVCAVTSVNTASRNCSAKTLDVHTHVRACARNCLWQPRGANVEPLEVPKLGTCDSEFVRSLWNHKRSTTTHTFTTNIHANRYPNTKPTN